MLKINRILSPSFSESRSSNRYLLVLLFICLTVIGIARGLQHFYIVDTFESVQFSLRWHIPFNIFLWWSWFLFIPFIYLILNKIKEEKSKVYYWVSLYFLLPIIIVVIRQAIASFIITFVLVGYSDFTPLLYRRLFSNPWIWLDIIVYFAILIGMLVLQYQHKSKLTGLKFTQLQAQLAQTQLNALKSQLHPHFLFNTLNTISTLILKADNSEAERMLSLLNNFFKKTVFESERQEISLAEELRFIKDYLEIQKVRFSDRLEIKEDVEEESLNARVPSFILQPIVENAIYHAIAPQTSKGLIRITSSRENGQLELSIEDNGPGLREGKEKSKEGIGLRITKERLAYLFGKNHQFELENVKSGGLRVKIIIPFINSNGIATVS